MALDDYKFKILKATELAAIAAHAKAGSGDKLAIDLEAVTSLEYNLNKIDFLTEVKISEGEKDKSHMLDIGNHLGTNKDEQYEIIVDPVDGTTQTSKLGYEAMSVVVLTEKDSVNTLDCHYMNKLAFGPRIVEHINSSFLPVFSLSDPISLILQKVSKILGKPISDITVCVLDRSRHNKLIADIRNVGAKTKLIPDCDLSAAIATCIGDVDLQIGIGGQPEAYLSAAALKCLGGMQQIQVCDKEGNVTDSKIYNIDDLISKDVIFSATSITDSNLLNMKGIRHKNNKTKTQSLLMSSKDKQVHKLHSFHS